jgi:F0F1-type ATP synthase membrane subunit b/b'
MEDYYSDGIDEDYDDEDIFNNLADEDYLDYEGDYDLEYEDLDDLLDLGASIPKVPSIRMPSFPRYTIPKLPKPPVAVTKIDRHFRGLNTWYKDVTGKTFKYSYGTKVIQARGLGPFFVEGARKISGWYKPRKCGSLDVGCVISNIKKAFNGINHTRGFLAYASQLVATYTAKGMDLNTKAGKDILKNLNALPNDIKKWFTDLQNNYTKALKDYNKKIQDEMLKTVKTVRDNINKAFKDADKEFKKLLDRASKDVKKRFKDFEKEIKRAKSDFDKKVKDIQSQVTKATDNFNKNLKVVNDEIEKAKKSLDKIKSDVNKIREWSEGADERIRKLEAKVDLPSAPSEAEPPDYVPEIVFAPQKIMKGLI